MGKLTASWWSKFTQWEPSAQIALVIALLLLIIGIIALTLSPIDSRPPIYLGVVALLMVAQLVILWANRGMVTPFTRAQRAYLNEDFATALRILESYAVEHPSDVRALTFLGNTYRQLGDLVKSEEVLTKALGLAPEHHFPLVGFGRTLLAQGHYQQAADLLRQALLRGAPEIVSLDLGEALYRTGSVDAARDTLHSLTSIKHEPYRALMAAYLLSRVGEGSVPSFLVHQGLPYWQASAERFAHTAYGSALAEDVRRMRSYIEETT